MAFEGKFFFTMLSSIRMYKGSCCLGDNACELKWFWQWSCDGSTNVKYDKYWVQRYKTSLKFDEIIAMLWVLYTRVRKKNKWHTIQMTPLCLNSHLCIVVKVSGQPVGSIGHVGVTWNIFNWPRRCGPWAINWRRVVGSKIGTFT